MLRRWVLTVFNETDSSPAISCRDRLVGRYRSTLSSPGLSSSAGGNEDCRLAAGDEPSRTSRMSVSSAACAVWCRGSASSSSPEPVIANDRTSRSDSARASARPPSGWPRAGHRAHGERAATVRVRLFRGAAHLGTRALGDRHHQLDTVAQRTSADLLPSLLIWPPTSSGWSVSGDVLAGIT